MKGDINLKPLMKNLYYKEIYRRNSESKSYIRFQVYFDLNNLFTFVVTTPTYSAYSKNPFKALLDILEHEIKYKKR